MAEKNWFYEFTNWILHDWTFIISTTWERHSLRICFLISLEGSNQFCKTEGRIHTGQAGNMANAHPVSHFALIAVSVPNESLSIWLNKETEPSPAVLLKCAESRFDLSICFFIVLQNHWQPATYLISSHTAVPCAAAPVGAPFLVWLLQRLIGGAVHTDYVVSVKLCRSKSCKSCCWRGTATQRWQWRERWNASLKFATVKNVDEKSTFCCFGFFFWLEEFHGISHYISSYNTVSLTALYVYCMSSFPQKWQTLWFQQTDNRDFNLKSPRHQHIT